MRFGEPGNKSLVYHSLYANTVTYVSCLHETCFVPLQLIWRGSRYFGVGKVFNNEMCIVVAYYFPPGNTVEEFEENVGVVEDNVDGVSTNETRTPTGIIAEYGQYGR